ncbi:hypothetical protein Aph01nite_48280 [Acrocarpospora phusangensis]|uniref:HTH cro/C1-type domain-containing protein n=1 Tax=Acrocarpospora phusangensis TaxID=1070424 RepID=A0A919QFE5_9ACTN|nr:helix-turn-helix transcriptional regulator [Acrocarpospora phusangensis]GIH26518.1 hypothetical protein Aph01nite_48280 [Acrocarpospora phusangensis]
MTVSEALGDRLRQLRKEAGLTQDRLARRAHVNDSYISLIETGRRVPSPEVTAALAAELGCTAEYLLYGKAGIPVQYSVETRNASSRRLLRPLKRPLAGFRPGDKVEYRQSGALLMITYIRRVGESAVPRQ